MSIIHDNTPNNKWYPYDHWYSSPLRWVLRIIATSGIVIIILIGCYAYHRYNYVCLRGHYYTSYGKYGEHYIWCCEEEILRSDYNKMINKPVIPCGCH